MDARRNIELKARIRSKADATETARRIGAKDSGLLRQVDTYFVCRDGRLKLREINGEQAELIWYTRPDQSDSKLSQYRITPIENPDDLIASLEAANGIETVVRKARDLWLYENVRIHLDSVESLGEFLEFEAVLGPEDSIESGEAMLARLRTEFKIGDEDLLSGSYRELMLAR